MSSSVVRRHKIRKSPPQPLDRHLAEIGDSDGSVYINAGIDSTCCKKRGRTLHKLTNGIMVSSPSTKTTTTTKRTLKESSDDFASELSNDSSNDDQFDSINTRSCSHCGK
ncbi:unnamed protein product [Adineta steineri]|uniref:Uncharacterized protein n=1 Tax=Adineta steineri TaxID=433720 RepID=A0A813VBH6_9BILA|nr:unnamed protein product [Adineta steineri]CAF0835136.1 unnamed protein product [Adineta steineri]CAF0950138.1 unnamed protein product [Adineta steineri]CAF1073027.1 unnamed protein product [Adineta steineri]CAF1366269.1 unnamed protein product [Adineta steineri]